MAAALTLVVLDGEAGRLRSSPVAVPPLREISFAAAVIKGRCSVAARHPARPVGAAPPEALRAQILMRRLTVWEREGSLRRGYIVIEYRDDVPSEALGKLEMLQRAVPTATVLAPGPDSGAPLVVASARRELRCGVVSDGALDALRLFRGRYVGTTGNG